MVYITYQDIEKFLNITLTSNGQTLVNELIQAVETFTEDYCNRKWSYGASADIIEYFDGGTDTYFPQNTPIASVQEITVDGSVYDSNYIYNYGSYIKTLHALNPAYPRGVKITYRTSSNTIPSDLKHALVRWVSEIFKTQEDAGKTVSRVSVGSISVDFLTQDGIPKFVEKLLNKYRLIPGF